MAIYAFWNNLGGVGKSYLTFQVACEYARTHPNQNVLVVDLCTQAKSSAMLLGGIFDGEARLEAMYAAKERNTVGGYIAARLQDPASNPQNGANFIQHPAGLNRALPHNLFLVAGDSILEQQAALVSRAALADTPDAWPRVHRWVSDLIDDVRRAWNQRDMTVFIDCSTSFTIFTELGLAATDRLMIPITADAASKRAVRTVMALLYGIGREAGEQRSDFAEQALRHKVAMPKVYGFVCNHISKFHGSGGSIPALTREIGQELYALYADHPNVFWIKPKTAVDTQGEFDRSFRFEINDANYATTSSALLGLPLMTLGLGTKEIVRGKTVLVKQWHLDRAQPNLRRFMARVE